MDTDVVILRTRELKWLVNTCLNCFAVALLFWFSWTKLTWISDPCIMNCVFELARPVIRFPLWKRTVIVVLTWPDKRTVWSNLNCVLSCYTCLLFELSTDELNVILWTACLVSVKLVHVWTKKLWNSCKLLTNSFELPDRIPELFSEIIVTRSRELMWNWSSGKCTVKFHTLLFRWFDLCSTELFSLFVVVCGVYPNYWCQILSLLSCLSVCRVTWSCTSD